MVEVSYPSSLNMLQILSNGCGLAIMRTPPNRVLDFFSLFCVWISRIIFFFLEFLTTHHQQVQGRCFPLFMAMPRLFIFFLRAFNHTQSCFDLSQCFDPSCCDLCVNCDFRSIEQEGQGKFHVEDAMPDKQYSLSYQDLFCALSRFTILRVSIE